MSVPQPVGGHSSNRVDGPAGIRGLKIVDIPFDPVELEVDLDLFRQVAPLVRPRVITLGTSMTLFPFPVQAMHEIVAEWGGSIFFDGAHQLGLIAGHQYQDNGGINQQVIEIATGKALEADRDHYRRH